MEQKRIEDNLKYLSLLAKDYPDAQAAAAEIVSLQAQLKLPKGTEMYMSDIHGEDRAFSHMMNRQYHRRTACHLCQPCLLPKRETG